MDPCYVARYIQSKNSGQENKIVERTKRVGWQKKCHFSNKIKRSIFNFFTSVVTVIARKHRIEKTEQGKTNTRNLLFISGRTET